MLMYLLIDLAFLYQTKLYHLKIDVSSVFLYLIMIYKSVIDNIGFMIYNSIRIIVFLRGLYE